VEGGLHEGEPYRMGGSSGKMTNKNKTLCQLQNTPGRRKSHTNYIEKSLSFPAEDGNGAESREINRLVVFFGKRWEEPVHGVCPVEEKGKKRKNGMKASIQRKSQDQFFRTLIRDGMRPLGRWRRPLPWAPHGRENTEGYPKFVCTDGSVLSKKES